MDDRRVEAIDAIGAHLHRFGLELDVELGGEIGGDRDVLGRKRRVAHQVRPHRVCPGGQPEDEIGAVFVGDDGDPGAFHPDADAGERLLLVAHHFPGQFAGRAGRGEWHEGDPDHGQSDQDHGLGSYATHGRFSFLVRPSTSALPAKADRVRPSHKGGVWLSMVIRGDGITSRSLSFPSSDQRGRHPLARSKPGQPH